LSNINIDFFQIGIFPRIQYHCSIKFTDENNPNRSLNRGRARWAEQLAARGPLGIQYGR